MSYKIKIAFLIRHVGLLLSEIIARKRGWRFTGRSTFLKCCRRYYLSFESADIYQECERRSINVVFPWSPPPGSGYFLSSSGPSWHSYATFRGVSASPCLPALSEKVVRSTLLHLFFSGGPSGPKFRYYEFTCIILVSSPEDQHILKVS